MENTRSLSGRGAAVRPANRFDGRTRAVPLDVLPDEDRNPDTRFLPDQSRSVVSENQSPDVGFRFSLNPYRGCEHGCSYCYARPTHEYLGFDAGLDFETRITVKYAAPRLFREFLSRPEWEPEPIALSGVTDPYQPCERQFLVTRRCLEVAADAGQPVAVITKNPLVTRDLDVLAPMAARRLAEVNVSLTTLDPQLARAMEPRAGTPAARLRAVRELAAAGVPVRVLVSPVVPGLTDHELPAILEAAKEAGARAAGYALLRLPGAVREVFLDWLGRHFPDRREKVLARVRDVRAGRLNDTEFGRRMTGTGQLAGSVAALFRVFARRHGLDGGLPEFDLTHFRRPADARGQGRLF